MSKCPCPKHPFGCIGHPKTCGCSDVTDVMVTAAMREFERYAARLLRYSESERWHLNDVTGMREAIKAALKTRAP